MIMLSIPDFLARYAADGYCYSTGLEELDELIGCISGGSVIEFYGDLDVLVSLSYRLVAKWSCYGNVALLVAQSSPLLYDFYEIKKRALLENCQGSVTVSRSFRIEDTTQLLSEANTGMSRSYVLFDPFVHAVELPPKERWRLSSVVRHIRRLSGHGARVAIFNRYSVFSRSQPEGGSLYRHSVHVSVMLEKVGKRGVKALLVKHPSRGSTFVFLSIDEIEGRAEWVGQALLSEWL